MSGLGTLASSYVITIIVLFVGQTVLGTQDEFHLSCKDKSLVVSGPLAEIHAECSKDLTPEQETNLCEIQCVRKREELLDENGVPSPEKHKMYAEKLAGKDIAPKIEKHLLDCFEKHGAGMQPMDKDPNCATTKALNECHKEAMMHVCD